MEAVGAGSSAGAGGSSGAGGEACGGGDESGDSNAGAGGAPSGPGEGEALGCPCRPGGTGGGEAAGCGVAGCGSLAGMRCSDGRETTGRLSTAGVYLRRNLRLRSVTLPDPSTRTTYWWNWRTSITMPVLSHLVG